MSAPDFNQTRALVDALTDIAMHKAEIAELRRDISDLHAVVREMRDAMRGMSETMAEARGGWKTLIWIGTSCASMGAGLTWLAEHILRK